MVDNTNRRPLLFHKVHGSNVGLFKNGRVAKRVESFCMGIAFSNRPVAIDEIVVMKIAETAVSWTGVVRFGLTNNDPATYRNNQLPKYACPEMTNKPGNWAKAVTERYCQQGNHLHFIVCANGDVYYGVNGVSKGLFLTGIDVSKPLWVLVDIYGNSIGLEFMDPLEVPSIRCATSLSSGPPVASVMPRITRPISSAAHQDEVISPHMSSLGSAPAIVDLVQNNLEDASVPRDAPQQGDDTGWLDRMLRQRLWLAGSTSASSPSTPHLPAGSATGDGLNRDLGRLSISNRTNSASTEGRPRERSREGTNVTFSRLEFSRALTGRNVRLWAEGTIASRVEDEYSSGYVFLNRPVKLEEKVVLQVIAAQSEFAGGLAFGLTTCDPAGLNQAALPDNADLLLDRPEYWVVQKDVAAGPKVHDELCFWISRDGEVHYYRNASNPRIIMHVDHSQPLYMFFDVYGTTQRVRLVGSCPVTAATRPKKPNTHGTPSPSHPSRSHRPVSSGGSLVLDSAGHHDRQRHLRVNLPESSSIAHSSTRRSSAIPVTSSATAQSRQNRALSGDDIRVALDPPPSRGTRERARLPDPLNPTIVSSPARAGPHSAGPGAPPHSTPHYLHTSASTHQSPTLTPPALPPRPSSTSNSSLSRSMPSPQSSPALAVQASSSASALEPEGGDSECIVCMEAKVDSVIYSCGHMCMCFACAKIQWSRHGVCPVCRLEIKDIIKPFRS